MGAACGKQDKIRVKTLKGHTGKVVKIGLTVDKTKILSLSTDQTLKMWHIDSRQLLKDSEFTNNINQNNNNNSYPPSTGYPLSPKDTERKIKKMLSNNNNVVQPLQQQPTTICENNNNKNNSNNNNNNLFNSADSGNNNNNQILQNWIQCIELCPKYDRLFFTGGGGQDNGEISVWNQYAFKKIGQLTEFQDPLQNSTTVQSPVKRNLRAVCSLCFSECGKKLFSGDLGGDIVKWEVNQLDFWEESQSYSKFVKQVYFESGHTQKITNLKVIKAQNKYEQLFSSSLDKQIIIWDVQSCEKISIIHSKHSILTFDIAPQKDTIVLGHEKFISIWDKTHEHQISKQQQQKQIGSKKDIEQEQLQLSKFNSGHGNKQTSRKILPISSHHRLTSLSPLKKKLKPLTLTEIRSLTNFDDPNGNSNATQRSKVKLSAKKQEVDLLLEHVKEYESQVVWKQSLIKKRQIGRINSLNFSADGLKLVLGGQDKSVSLMCAKNGKILTQLQGHKESVNQVIFQKDDGSRILSCSDDGDIKEWRIPKKYLLSLFPQQIQRTSLSTTQI